jgi:hypothetical protein
MSKAFELRCGKDFFFPAQVWGPISDTAGLTPGIKWTERGFDKPPHLALRLRKSKRVHLLPCCPFTSYYNETFNSSVKISLGFYHTVRKTIFVHDWFRLTNVCSKTFTRHTWLPGWGTICGQRPSTEGTKNLHILLNGNVSNVWLVRCFRLRISVDRLNILLFQRRSCCKRRGACEGKWS